MWKKRWKHDVSVSSKAVTCSLYLPFPYYSLLLVVWRLSLQINHFYPSLIKKPLIFFLSISINVFFQLSADSNEITTIVAIGNLNILFPTDEYHQ